MDVVSLTAAAGGLVAYAPTLLSRFLPEKLERVEVNLNALSADGLVRVRGSRFAQFPALGLHVAILESEEEVEGVARVARTDPDSDLVYLDVAWDSLHDQKVAMAHTVSAGPNVSPGGVYLVGALRHCVA